MTPAIRRRWKGPEINWLMFGRFVFPCALNVGRTPIQIQKKNELLEPSNKKRSHLRSLASVHITCWSHPQQNLCKFFRSSSWTWMIRAFFMEDFTDPKPPFRGDLGFSRSIFHHPSSINMTSPTCICSTARGTGQWRLPCIHLLSFYHANPRVPRPPQEIRPY